LGIFKKINRFEFYPNAKRIDLSDLKLSEINKIRIRIAAEITGKIPTA